MSIAAIKAGKAFYEIFAKDNTSKGLSSAEQKLMRFGTKIGLIGTAMAGFAAASLTGLTMMIKGFAGAGDAISDAMNVTGLSSDFLQTLQFGAADAGVSFDALVGSLTKFNTTLAKAASGNKVANAALAKMGLNINSLMAMSPDDRFKAVAEAISKISDPAQRAAAAVAMFGKTGAKLLPAIEGGATSLNEAMADLKANGQIMSDEDRQLAVEAEGAFLSLSLALSRVSQVIAAAVTPAFLKIMSVLQSVVQGVVQFIDNNRTLVAWITGGIVVIGALGLALMSIGAIAIAASMAATGLAAAMSAVGAIAAFLASPVFLIVAAIVACGAAALVAAYYLDQLFNGGAALNFLKDAAMGAWEAMQLLWMAVSNGKWALAGQLIGNALKLGFYGAILAIKEAWNSLTLWMIESFAKAIARLESQLPTWIKDRFNIGEFTANIAQDARARGNDGLADDRAAVAEAAAALAKIAADIRLVGEEAKAKRQQQADTADFGIVSDNMRQSSLMSGSAGAFSSAAAARLGFAAPANIAEKQLNAAMEGNKLLEGINDKIEELEGLTAD